MKFRLRTLLLAVLLCCLGLGGLRHQNQKHRREMAAVSAIREAGGLVEIEQSDLGRLLVWAGEEYQATFDRVTKVDFTAFGGDELNGPTTTLVARGRAGSRIDELALLRQARSITGKHLEHLRSLGDLESLNLHGASVTDSGLVHLEKLTRLRALSLSGNHITDKGLMRLKSIAEATALRRLDLNRLRISEVGCAALAELTTLEELHLSDTRVNDAGLRHLASLPHLRRLCLYDYRMNYHLNVTADAVTALRTHNPNLTVDWNGPQTYRGYTK